MNIVNRLTLRSLKANKRRTIVTIIGIILAAAMITGVMTIAESFQDVFVQSAIQTDGNFHATFYDVRSDNTKYILENPYTKTAMFTRDMGFAMFAESPNPNTPYLRIREYDKTAMTHMPIQLVRGRFPEKEGEAVIAEDIFAIAGERYRIGQTVTLNIGNRMDQGIILKNESLSESEILQPVFTKTFSITGIIARPRFERASTAPGYTMVTYLNRTNLTDAEAVNVSILAANPKKQLYDRIPEIADNASVEVYKYNNELLRWKGITNNIGFHDLLRSISLIISLLIAIGSVAVIYNAFAISVSERKKQFGMLASVGATPKQIRRSVFFEGTVLGAIGIPLGILSGFAGIGITLTAVNRLMVGIMLIENVALRPVVSLATVAATVIFVSLIIFFSAYIPARNASRISPIDAIRLNYDLKVPGKQLKTSKLTKRMFGVEGELALKNLKRNRRRYRATVFSLFISIVLFVSISSFMTFAFQSTDMYYEDVMHNGSVQKLISPEEQKQFFAPAASLDIVERYAMVRTIGVVSDNIPRPLFGSYILQNYIDKDVFISDPDGNIRSFRSQP